VLCLQELENVVEAGERAAAEKRVKSRTLGTVRLIAELYRKEVVSENIITVCIRELLEVGGRGVCLGGGQMWGANVRAAAAASFSMCVLDKQS
jgi:hypothetical protein